MPTCWGSEGGHTEWSPRNDVDVGLQRYLQEKYTAEGSRNRVSVERVVSGPGLADTFEYLLTLHPELSERETQFLEKS